MKPYSWVAKGDVNAFFGLMLDNITNLVILSGLLIGVFNFPEDYSSFQNDSWNRYRDSMREPHVYIHSIQAREENREK